MQGVGALLQNLSRDALKLPQIHAILITTGFFVSLTGNHLSGRQKSAVFAYNSLITSYVRHQTSLNAAHQLFAEMLANGIQPDCYSFPPLFKAAGRSLLAGCAIHSQVARRGLINDGFINCSVVDFYSRLHDLVSARRVFAELSCPDMASCNSMLNAFCVNGEVVSAVWLFERMVDHDIVSWTSLVNGYMKNGNFREAIELFKAWLMQQDLPVRLNEAMLVSVLSACANLDEAGALLRGLEIHGYIIRTGIRVTAFLGTALIDMYGKHGRLSNCTNVFEMSREREVCTWNSLIMALAANGREADALCLFDKMRASQLHPNHITFVAVLTACARAKLVDMGLRYFKSMYSKYCVAPLMEHYGCVVDLLSRAGFLDEAIEFIRRMPFDADASVLGALLGACRVHENGRIAVDVGTKLISLQPWHSGSYMILRNIYAGDGRWDHAAEFKGEMEKAGVEKFTGYSLIHCGNHASI